MKSNKLTFLLVLITTLTLSSCSERLVDFTVISSKNHGLKFDKNEGIDVKAKSLGFLGLGASIKDAMDKALRSAGKDYDLLIDGVVRMEIYPFVSGYSVEGTAVSSKQLKASLGIKGFEEWCNSHNIFDPSTDVALN